MPAARARRLCPGGIFLPPDFGLYRDVSRRVMAIVRRHVEKVEVVGFDEAYLELTGLPAPHATMRMVRAEIERAEGLSCSTRIGPSKRVAKGASDADNPRRFVVLTPDTAGPLGSRSGSTTSPQTLAPIPCPSQWPPPNASARCRSDSCVASPRGVRCGCSA